MKSSGFFRPIHLLMVLFALLSVALTALGQLPTATILGEVKDPSGAVIPGAALTARNVDTGLTRTAVTADAGTYRFDALPVGKYEVRAEHTGFQSELRSGLTLTVAQEAVVNITLQVGATSQTVNVTGEVPLVNTTTSELGGLVSEQRLADLPLNGRNYINLTLLQPGVVQQTSITQTGALVGTVFSSNGATERSNNFLLDGAIMTTLNGLTSASLSGTTLGLDGIREFRVITNSFSAEYGMAMGSQTLIVSRNGTNNFHGSLFEFLRNSAFDARNFFDRKTATNLRRLPLFIRNNFGGSFGGPIKKDKTFFFGTYEALRERVGVTQVTNDIASGCRGGGGITITNATCPQLGAVSSVVISPVIAPILAQYPSPNLGTSQLTFPFSQPNTENYGQLRVDQTFSAKDSLFGRYTTDDDQQIQALAYPQFNNQRLSRSQFATLSETHLFSASVLSTFRFSYSRTAGNRVSPTSLIGPQYSLVPSKPIGQIAIGGVTTLGPQPAAPADQTQNILSVSDDLFYSRGRHSLKFGALINSYRQYILNSSNVNGTVSFANVAAFLQGVANSYNAVTPGSLSDRTYRFYTMGFYAQDDLRLRSTLTLNLGLRYEPSTQVEALHGYSSSLINVQTDAAYTPGILFKNPSHKNFSPRVGFAWDVTGDGKTAVRGGFGLLYDVGNIGSAFVGLTIGTPPFSSSSTVSSGSLLTLSSLPLVFPASAVGKAGNYTWQYHLQQTHLLSEHLTVERQLPFSMSLSVSYAASRGIHLLQNSEGNPNVPLQIVNGMPTWSPNLSLTLPRVNPNWGNMTYIGSQGDSTYNALQVSLVKRMSKGLEFQSSYTWSRLINDTESQQQLDSNATSVYVTNPFNRRTDRGPANFDVPQNWAFNTIYSLPSPTNDRGVAGQLAKGWVMSGILTLHNGLPFTPCVVTQRSRSGVLGAGTCIDHPDRNPSFSGNIILGGPSRYYNANAFMLQPVGHLGNVGRNILQGPGFANFDFSVRKNSKIGRLGESGNLEFRADFFNILNRANFAEPNFQAFSGALANASEAPLGTAGVITSTVNASRQIQLSLRLSF